MTDKTTAWFDEIRQRAGGGTWWHRQKSAVMAALGRVFYTNARINGKSKRVRIWIP